MLHTVRTFSKQLCQL